MPSQGRRFECHRQLPANAPCISTTIHSYISIPLPSTFSSPLYLHLVSFAIICDAFRTSSCYLYNKSGISEHLGSLQKLPTISRKLITLGCCIVLSIVLVSIANACQMFILSSLRRSPPTPLLRRRRILESLSSSMR